VTGTRLRATVILASVAALVVSCSGGSSKSSTNPSSSSSGASSGATKQTVKVGLLVDNTGIAASGQKHVEDGMKAAIHEVAKDGYNVKYVVVDTQSNPSAALAGAQKLVTQEHVDAVIAHSALFFTAAPYLTKQGVPVIGVAEDGPEWTTSKNMFAVYGALHTEKVTATGGKVFKLLGATTVGALGYSISPSSAEAAKAAGVSAEAAGLKAGYINAKFPFGSTNVAPVAAAMKSSGVDGVTPDVDPNTSFALIQALKNNGANVKAFVLPIGYGGDLLQAGPGTLKTAQNVYFTLQYEPIEMHTPATEKFAAALKATGGTDAPGLPTYDGYASILLLVQGLKDAGANPTHASLIAALSKVHNFNPGGLYGDHPLDPNDRVNNGDGNCTWVLKLVGDSFQLVKGALPMCGEILPGKTVSP
jgi:ABC-type branched-subunit amino acid transport system substrate-binding protein